MAGSELVLDWCGFCPQGLDGHTIRGPAHEGAAHGPYRSLKVPHTCLGNVDSLEVFVNPLVWTMLGYELA